MPSLLGPIDALESAASSSDTAPVKRQEVSQLSLSEAGLDFIKQHEVLKEEHYRDSADKPTIGYGHRIWRDEAEDFRHPIDEDIARQLLSMDVEHAENAVHRYAKGLALSQHEYDALVSFVFNIGGGAFARSSVLEQLKAGDFSNAAKKMSEWVKVTQNGERVFNQGLANRRVAEQILFSKGVYKTGKKGAP